MHEAILKSVLLLASYLDDVVEYCAACWMLLTRQKKETVRLKTITAAHWLLKVVVLPWGDDNDTRVFGKWNDRFRWNNQADKRLWGADIVRRIAWKFACH
jgi:hypothetical protein